MYAVYVKTADRMAGEHCQLFELSCILSIVSSVKEVKFLSASRIM